MMVVLVTINLLWIVFDWLFASTWIASGIHWLSPAFHDFYAEHVHPNFVVYDLMFVAVYVVELLLRWAVAIVQKTYHRWFFYPFVHWYDVLGCIPIGSFRFLRILRVISIVYRLQRLGVIDIREMYLYQVAQKYIGIVTEELSDRIVVNVLSGVQSQLQKGSPVAHEIQDQVLKPQREELVLWLGSRLGHAIDYAYDEHESEVRDYLKIMVHESLQRNSNVKLLHNVPVVGGQVQTAIEGMSVELVEDILITLLSDLADPERRLLANIINSLLDSPIDPEAQNLWPILQNAIIDSLELVKKEIRKQQWKLTQEDESTASTSATASA